MAVNWGEQLWPKRRRLQLDKTAGERTGKDNLGSKQSFKSYILFSFWPGIRTCEKLLEIQIGSHYWVVSNDLFNLDEEFGKNKIGGLITKQRMEEACGQTSLNRPRKREYLWMTWIFHREGYQQLDEQDILSKSCQWFSFHICPSSMIIKCGHSVRDRGYK